MTIAIIAPHADDETLGCGGSILKHKNKNDKNKSQAYDLKYIGIQKRGVELSIKKHGQIEP